jgi:hypothetical protein
MALISPADRKYTITTVDGGNYKALGEVSKSGLGAWSVGFYPDDDWIGTITIVARPRGVRPNEDAAGYGTIAYIRQQVNYAAADYELVPDVIQGAAIVLVPSDGLSIAIAIECSRGTCVMYSHPLEGATTPSFRTGGVLEGA